MWQPVCQGVWKAVPRPLRLLPVLLLFFLMMPLAAEAQVRRVLTAYPRAVARTAWNMLTFKSKQAAIEQWVVLGAVLYDIRSTDQRLRACARCTEATSWFYGVRPGTRRLYAQGSAVAFTYGAMIQLGHEQDAGGPRIVNRIAPAGFAAAVAAGHTMAARDNLALHRSCQAAQLSCR